MNNAPPNVQRQCYSLLEWMQDRSDELLLDKQYEDMFALYMEWHEWIEEDNPPVMILDKED